MLTSTDLQVLRRPFEPNDHEFIRGFVYLTEESICNRLEEVDPGWQFEILNIASSGDNAIAHARMTINGVSREGVGMQKINEKAGEAEKGAATDALKRCARLFGVGRYLLGAPEQAKFGQWLNGISGRNPRTPQPTANGNPPAKSAQNGNAPAQPDGSDKPWKDTYKDFVADWVAKGVAQDVLLSILGVERFGLWTKTHKDADAAVTAYLAAEQKSAVA